MIMENKPRLWVSTWGKYNDGSLDGDWFDLEDYADKEEFLEAARKRHKDDPDPEFLFNDFEGFPKAFYWESGVHDKLFEFIHLDTDDREVVEAYIDGVLGDVPDDFENAREKLMRVYDEHKTGADFAEEFAEEIGAIPEDMPTWISVDWEHTWKGNLRFDFDRVESEGKTYFFNAY